MKKSRKAIFFLLALNIAWLAFILINSMIPPSLSQEQSMGLLDFTASFFESLNIKINISEHFLRKCAHFFEYFMLGILYFSWIPLLRKKLKNYIIYPLSFSLATAVADESIQILSGRGPLVQDILLDFCASASAILLSSIILFIYRAKNR